MAASVLSRCLRFRGGFVRFPGDGLGRAWAWVLVAGYRHKPLRLNVSGVYIPDRESKRTPDWQKESRYDAKLYGRYGAASGVDPAMLWPDPERLREVEEEEREWYPSLQEMQRSIAEKEEEARKKHLAREKLIAVNMAKMPQMVEDWRREKRELKQRQQEEKARRERLLAVARERFGYSIDPRSPKFQEMVKEVEKEEKKKKKLLKRQQKEESVAAGMPSPAKAPSVPTSD